MTERLLTTTQVRQRYGGISRMTLHRWRHDKAKGFPEPVNISPRCCWRESDLDRWERERAARKAVA